MPGHLPKNKQKILTVAILFVTCQGLYLENMSLSHTCLVYLKSLVILLLSLFVILKLLVYQWSLAIVINFSFFSSLLLPLVVFSCT